MKTFITVVFALVNTVRAQGDGTALWKDCDPNGQRGCCISNCKCLYEIDKTINKIECTDQKLRVIQQPNQPANIKEYDLSRNNIENIPRDTFKGMLSLETLNISRNSLTSLDPGSFSGLSQSLRVLDLSSNRFEQLPTRAFKAVLGLTNLYVSRNRVKKLGPLEFAPLGNLSVIDISFNPGVVVSEDAFRQLDNLRELVFKSCKLTSIPNFSDARRELRRLNLAGNNLSKVVPGNFKNMRLLETLILRNNAITSVDRSSFEVSSINSKSKRPDLLESPDAKPKCAQPVKWLNIALDNLGDKYSAAWCKTRSFYVNKYARTGREGSDIQLECNSRASNSNSGSNKKIKWFNPDGKAITLQSKNYKTRVQISGPSLSIKSLKIEDSGTWTCYNEDTDYVADTEFTVTPASGEVTTLYSTSTIRAVESVTSGPNAVLNPSQSSANTNSRPPSVIETAGEPIGPVTTGEPLRRTRIVIGLFIGLTLVCAIVLIIFYKKRRRKPSQNEWETRKLRPEEHQPGTSTGRASGAAASQHLTRSSIPSYKKYDEQIRPQRHSPQIAPEDALGTPIGPPELASASRSRVQNIGGTLPSQKKRISANNEDQRKFHSQPGTLGRNAKVKDIIHHLEANPPRKVSFLYVCLFSL
ncbi:unnamed protein product [Oikopleura dioica]|uniref:Ig-like domain-containing protein n=1 Tax=Oikopleura dioica TaxID=34765 RepID=E4XT74_OIKDI|nr:unnamed protein product [Oikopleura dioica]